MKKYRHRSNNIFDACNVEPIGDAFINEILSIMFKNAKRSKRVEAFEKLVMSDEERRRQLLILFEYFLSAACIEYRDKSEL